MDVASEQPFGIAIAFDTKNNKIFTTIPNIDAISIITTEDMDIMKNPLQMLAQIKLSRVIT
jgi:hypothetical protein